MTRMPDAVEVDVGAGPGVEGARRATGGPDPAPTLPARAPDPEVPATVQRRRFSAAYNRLVDIFTGITCYSLQNHLRTSVPDIGQVETDELYVGVDRKGRQYVLPVQAKGGRDELNVVQIEQDTALCESKFPDLICLPVAAQFMRDRVIALFSFEKIDGEVKVLTERHYKLVEPNEISQQRTWPRIGRAQTPTENRRCRSTHRAGRGASCDANRC